MSHRNAVIIGPSDTPFEDGTFRLVMHFEEQYPQKPPGVKFISTMFHPNVYATGELCLDILQNRWSPTYDVAAILTSIQRLVISREEDMIGLLMRRWPVAVCLTIQTPAHRQMWRLRICTRIVARSIRRGSGRRWRRVGMIERGTLLTRSMTIRSLRSQDDGSRHGMRA